MFPERRLAFVEHNMNPFKEDANTESKSGTEDDPFVLCPEKVLVHSLSDNQLYYVAMSKLHFPTWTPGAWDRLVKPRSESTANSINRIRRLAEGHARAKSAKVDRGVEKGGEILDNFRGKGKGLTFLLHGPSTLR